MRRLAAVLLLSVVSALGLSACGEKEAVTEAESEGISIDVGGVKYQVQISRQLNAAAAEDEDYFRELPASEAALPPSATWFGVFVQVRNVSEEPAPSARSFAIRDTTGEVFRPVPVRNGTAYVPQLLDVGGAIPEANDVTRFSPTQGALLLFKLPYASLENRPLELMVESPRGEPREGSIVLDV